MSTPHSKAAWMRWGKRLFLLGLAGAVVFAALTFFLARFLDPEALAARVEPRLEAALARDVEVERVELRLFPLGVRLVNLTVADPTGAAPFLARVGGLELRAAFLPLLRKEVRLSRLVLADAQVDLRVGPGGRANFGDFSTQTSQAEAGEEPEEAPDAFALDLKGIRISGADLRYENMEDSTLIRVQNLGVRASVSHDPSGPWLFEGDADGSFTSGTGGEAAGPGSLSFSSSFDLLAESGFQALEIRRGTLGAGRVNLEVSGRVGHLTDPVRDLALQLAAEGLPLEDLVAVVSREMSLEIPGEARGLIDAAFRVEGPLGPEAGPEVSGTVTLVGGGLEARDGTLVAQDFSADLTLVDPDHVRFQIAGELFDGPFSLEGSSELGGRGTLGADLRTNPDLSLAGSVVALPDGVTAAGRLNTSVRIDGSYRDLRSLRYRGEASPQDVRLTHPTVGVPVFLPEGRVALLGNGASFTDFPVILGEDRLVVTGEVQNLTSFGLPNRTVGVRGTVRGVRLDLTKISTKPPPDPALTYGKVAFAHLGERPIAGRSPEDAARALGLERPETLPLAGEIQAAIDTVIYPRGRVEELRARVELGPSLVRVTEASLRRFGGTVWTSMNLALGPRGQEPFNMSLQVRDLDAAEFLSSATPLGGAFRGNLSMDLELVGTLDGLLLPEEPSLVGSGRFSLTDGGLNSVPLTQALSSFIGITEIRSPDIQDWSSSFVMENGRIRLADARLAGAVGEPIVGGSIGLGGQLDLLSVFEVNGDNLGDFARQNLGIQDALAGRMEGRPGMVQAIVRIGGTLLSPELRGDPGAMVQRATETARDAVQAEAQRQIQQQQTQLQNRAAGFLRNLFQPGQTPGRVPPDSLAGDTIRPDSLQPDTVPPDTTLPDTLRPDTVGGDTIKPDTIRPDTTFRGGPAHDSPPRAGGGSR